MVAITIMLLAMEVMLPTWEYVEKNEREQELLFRGMQIRDAIIRFQRKQAGVPITSLEILVKQPQRELRQLYKDPMTKDGKWGLIPCSQPAGLPQGVGSGMVGSQPPPAARSGQTFVGPICGVKSLSTQKSIRYLLNGKQARYDEVAFDTRTVGTGQLGTQMPPQPPPGQPLPGQMAGGPKPRNEGWFFDFTFIGGSARRLPLPTVGGIGGHAQPTPPH